MNRVNFGARSGVIVDQCPRHGMWLEGGELRRLLEWRKAGGQILHERRRAERVAEEAQRERRRAREEARTRAEALEHPGEPPRAVFSTPGADAVVAFVRAVLRLFG
jgi:Zn-finger nucleic acid-binding protein